MFHSSCQLITSCQFNHRQDLFLTARADRKKYPTNKWTPICNLPTTTKNRQILQNRTKKVRKGRFFQNTRRTTAVRRKSTEQHDTLISCCLISVGVRMNNEINGAAIVREMDAFRGVLTKPHPSHKKTTRSTPRWRTISLASCAFHPVSVPVGNAHLSRPYRRAHTT